MKPHHKIHISWLAIVLVAIVITQFATNRILHWKLHKALMQRDAISEVLFSLSGGREAYVKFREQHAL